MCRRPKLGGSPSQMSHQEHVSGESGTFVEGVSVVIPVFNAEASISELCEQLIQELTSLGSEFEIVFVEDCSHDGSWRVIEDLAANEARIRGLKLSRNFGQHNALLCGIRAARYNIIVTMDDDLQHPPSELNTLLNKLTEGYDVVYGTPLEEQHGVLRDIASQLTKVTLQGAIGVENARHISAFRAFRTYLRDGFADYRSPNVSIDVLLSWVTSNFAVTKVRHDRRLAGESNYTLRKLIRHALNLMTGFSTLPLKIASVVGFAFTVFGLCVLAWVLVRYLVAGSSIPGFPFLASIIAIFSGAQLFTLGIFGEYLARIHLRTMDRPAYVIRQVSDSCYQGDEHPGVTTTPDRRETQPAEHQ